LLWSSRPPWPPATRHRQRQEVPPHWIDEGCRSPRLDQMRIRNGEDEDEKHCEHGHDVGGGDDGI
ncbi:unnamed protein product, partial [Symbiodinium microadriaticum]